MDYIFYHQVKPGVDCPDGIVAAWVVNRVCPEAEIYGCVYQEPAPIKPMAGDWVVVVDFSFPVSVIDGWQSSGVAVNLVDHHKTAMEMLGDLLYQFDGFKFDMNECGASLAWKTFFPGQPMPAFLEFVRSRDLWLDCDLFQNPIPETLIAHEALSGFRYELKEWAEDRGVDYRQVLFEGFDELAEMSREQYLEWARDAAMHKLTAKRRICQEIAARAEWKLFENPVLDRNSSLGDWCQPVYIPVVTLDPRGHEDRYTSDVCMVLYRQFPKAHFVVCITSDGTWSLRSDKDGNNTDVGQIAKALGGGGHRNAAGFKPTEGTP